MNRYTKKQIRIALIYFFILVLIGFSIFWLINLRGPSCSDGVQNQGEVGVDCGGPCLPCSWQTQEPIEIIYTKAIPTQENYVDLVAKIRNPNKEFGVKSFDYIFKIYDSEKNLVATKKGRSYILPQKIKYVIEQKNLIDSEISQVDFEIKNIQWQEFSGYKEPEFLIKNPILNQDNGVFLSATLENRSSYNFAEVDIYAILLNKNSEIIGAAKHKLYTVSSQELREFKISWPFYLKEKAENFEIITETNVFENTNFIKEYQRKEKEYYR